MRYSVMGSFALLLSSFVCRTEVLTDSHENTGTSDRRATGPVPAIEYECPQRILIVQTLAKPLPDWRPSSDRPFTAVVQNLMDIANITWTTCCSRKVFQKSELG